MLDNFEHLVSAATVVSALIAAAPRLKVLVTSRALLLLYGEHDFPVPPLRLPDPERLPPLSDLRQFESVQLFVDRAISLQPSFSLTESNSPTVAEICVRLDGLPLAIELAASRVRHMSPQAIQGRLGHRLALLTGGGRDRQDKHQTLRAAIDWSHDLLDPAEQALFARLAVFTGGCTLPAAEAVCNVDHRLDIDVLDGLSSLLDNSLLRLQEHVEGEHRYSMLRTIHEYAQDRLKASGDLTVLRREHARYFLQLAEASEGELIGTDEVCWFNRLEAEHDNLRSALKWSATVGGESTWGLRLCRVLWRFWHTHGHYAESRDWLDWARAAVEGMDDATLRADIVYRAGSSHMILGDMEEGAALVLEALQLFQTLQDEQGTSWALNDLAFVAVQQGDLALAKEHYQQSLALKLKRGDRWDAARLLGAALQLYADIGFVLDTANQQDFDSVCDGARSQLDEATWREARIEGQSWTVEHAVAAALDGPADDERISPTICFGPLMSLCPDPRSPHMTDTIIALLRGINVGGRNVLPMAELRAQLEGLGLHEVRSYIQSGNVVFRADDDVDREAGEGAGSPEERNARLALLSERITAAVEDSHGFAPRVLLLWATDFLRAAAANPFPEGESEPKTLHLYFLADEARAPDLASLESLRADSERFALVDDVFYLHAPEGIGRSKLAARVERALGVPATARNWRTVGKLVEMVGVHATAVAGPKLRD